MRGRLIFPFLLRIARIDTAAMRADPDGAGPLTSGYNDFGEPIKISAGSGPGTTYRIEKTSIDVPAQIEPDSFDRLRMVVAGNTPQARLQTVMHFKDLETLGLVTPTGEPTLQRGDRLAAIYTMQSVLVHDLSRVQLFATDITPAGFGLAMQRSQRNLLLVTWESRDKGITQ